MLLDDDELADLVEAAEQRGRVQLLGELVSKLRQRIHYPGMDLFLELVDGLVEREVMIAIVGAGEPQRVPTNGHG